MDRDPRERLTIRTTLVCAAALFAPLAWPLLTGRVFWSDDLANFHIPLRHLFQQSLASGDSLLWTPSVFSGFYLHGEGQVGFFHPLHQALYRLFPLTAAVNLELLLNYAAGFAGMYWFLRRLRFDAGVSLAGALVFAFSGFLVLHSHHLNLVAVAVHLPWLLAAADVLFEADRRRTRVAAYVAVALLVASEALLGFPQAVWFNFLVLGAFLAFRTAETRGGKPLALAVAACATGLMLGGIQWLPTLDAASESFRPLGSSAFALSLSLHPANLFQLWSPYLFARRVYTDLEYPYVHEYALYSCALLTVGPLWIYTRRHALGSRRRLAIWSGTCAAIALVLALGRYGGVYQFLTVVPGLRWMRGATRFVFLFQFGLALLVAIALEDLQTLAADGARVRVGRVLWLPVALSLLTTAAVSARFTPGFESAALAPPAGTAIGVIILLVVTGLLTLAARGVRAAVPALIIVTALDLGWAGVGDRYRLPPRTLASLEDGMPRPVDASRPERVFVRTPDFTGNRLLLNDVRLSSGYAALHPAMYLDPGSTLAMQLSGTRWIWGASKELQTVTGAMPRARLLPDARVIALPGHGDAREAELVLMHVDVLRTALVDRPVPPLTGPAGTARVLVDRPGHLVVETVAPGAQVLALTERFHSGWRASADGQALTTLRVHGDFLGSVVPGGSHRIEFRFLPDSFVRGCELSAAGLALLAAGALVTLRLR